MLTDRFELTNLMLNDKNIHSEFFDIQDKIEKTIQNLNLPSVEYEDLSNVYHFNTIDNEKIEFKKIKRRIKKLASRKANGLDMEAYSLGAIQYCRFWG